MKKAIIVVFTLCFAACQPKADEPSIKNSPEISEEPTEEIDAFDLDLSISKQSLEEYALSASLGLKKGDFVVSPFSEDSIYGHFEVTLDQNGEIELVDEMRETPNSVEEYDSIIGMPVKFIRVNTIFEQNMALNTKDDFDIPGLIHFVLEPSCVPYEVGFVISNKHGILSVSKTGTEIGSSYSKAISLNE